MRGLDTFKAFVTAVRDQSDLVRIVSRDVELRRAGNALKGLSPFHQEKHASFVVWPSTQTWHDFSNGGGLGGDVFSYIQEREKISFKAAVLLLAEQAGIRPPNQDEESWKRSLAIADERREVERLLTLAAGYYHRALSSDIREKHFRRHYGFSDETIDELQLGWADGKLFKHLLATTGLPREKLLATGLFHLLNDGRIIDLFRRRLVIPYWARGRVVYFTARAVDPIGKLPKYMKLRVHGPDQAYVSRTIRNDYLFNEDAARGANELVVTEGTPDCISARQAGVACVSPGTTTFRDQDLPRLLELSRAAKRIVICNDAEASGAGDKSAQKLAAALWAAGRDVAIAQIPRAEGVAKIDLNELVVAQGAEGLRAVLDQALPYPEFLLARIPHDTPKLEIAPRLEPVFAAALHCPPLRADMIVDAIGARFGLRRKALLATMKELEQRRETGAKKASAIHAASPLGVTSGSPGHVGAPGSPPRLSTRPAVSTTGRQLYEIVTEARDILARANEQRCQRAARERVDDDQGPLCVRGNVLCRLTYPPDEHAKLVVVTEPAMYGLMMREMDWVKETEQGPVPVIPPDKVAKDLIVFPPSAIPRVNKVITTPIFNRDGHLVIEPGLHVRDQLWHDQDLTLQVGDVPGRPTADDVTAARSLFLDHLLVDFKFDSQSDRAHALAALLLPFAQRMIRGCTPLHVMEAPGAGAGKSLLCTMISILLTGEDCTASQLPVARDEIRKTITAELLAARPLILLDNAKEDTLVDAPALAAVLTARTWTDRYLGLSEMVTVANNSMWMMTGNNPKLARDIARRSIRIRIDPKMNRPWLRAGFKHDPLEQWGKDNRSQLVRAVLVLIQAWIAAGRPLSRARLGSFQLWAQIVGGILEVIGVPGFLENLDQLYVHADDEEVAWREFTKVWWESHGSSQVTATVLFDLCDRKKLLAEVLGNGNPRSQQSKLGRALQRARDRVFDDLRVVIGAADRDSRTLYALQRVEDGSALGSPCDAGQMAVATERGTDASWAYIDDDDDDDAE